MASALCTGVTAQERVGGIVEFDRMVIKNPERLGNSDNKNEDNVAFESGALKTPAAKTLQYAEVINIEDPSKESI